MHLHSVMVHCKLVICNHGNLDASQSPNKPWTSVRTKVVKLQMCGHLSSFETLAEIGSCSRTKIPSTGSKRSVWWNGLTDAKTAATSQRAESTTEKKREWTKLLTNFVYFSQSYLIGECKQFALIYFDLIFIAPDNETLGLKLTSTVDPLMHLMHQLFYLVTAASL